MTLENDVRAVAHEFGIDPHLLQAVVNAEGDIVEAVHKTIPSVTTRTQALRIATRSAVHAMCDWIKYGGYGRREAYILYWGRRWRPLDEQDSDRINENWAGNVYPVWIHL